MYWMLITTSRFGQKAGYFLIPFNLVNKRHLVTRYGWGCTKGGTASFVTVIEIVVFVT
jgi:hypothetical protein